MTPNEKFVLKVKKQDLPVFIYGNGEVGQFEEVKHYETFVLL